MHSGHGSTKTIPLAIAALGVVFGDIGTSPLYTMRECFHGSHAVPPDAQNVLGVLSLVFWSIIIVVSIKYLAFILRADNEGEGGIFALYALIPRSKNGESGRGMSAVVITAIFGAALLYGDGVITPAISVLSAMEGLEVATSAATKLVVPLTCIILIGFFMFQKYGTTKIGAIFGPVMICWFTVLAILGAMSLIRNLSVLRAINPIYGLQFFHINGFHSMVIVGSVFLSVTGGEAVYADMGHFGKRPIRLSWTAIVCPALLLNYFGQGALLLTNPEAASHPFYSLVPRSLIYPMCALATAATVIASQALVSGAFSLTRQAVQLRFLPPVKITHTSEETEGQIYIRFINGLMAIGCITLVLVFQRSTNLAAAYGLAVTANMVITSILFFIVVTRLWHWNVWKAGILVGLFLIFDLTYFSANMLKLFHGGWIPLALAIVIGSFMATWKNGHAELDNRVERLRVELDLFIEMIARRKIHRVDGTAVVVSASSVKDAVPPVLLHHLYHNQVLQKEVVIVFLSAMRVPRVAREKQLKVDQLGNGFSVISANYGFMETPNVPDILNRAAEFGLKVDPMAASYYVGRETLVNTGKSKMPRWQKPLFLFMMKNSHSGTDYLGIPSRRVVELGVQIEI